MKAMVTQVIKSPKWSRRKGWGAALLFTTLLAAPVVAQPSFGPISLSPGFNPPVQKVSGYVRGSIDLHKVVGDRDVNNNRCMGYGSPEPDHILVLKGDFAKLTLQVNSGNKDTTLILQGPNNKLYCADDSQGSKDAVLKALQLKKGEYKAWVGTIDPGQKYRYSLSIQR